MAAETIKEYLAKLGFDVDQNSFTRFQGTVSRTTKDVGELGSIAVATAISIEAMVSRSARQYESLYYASLRVGSSAQSLLAYERAGKQIGITIEASRGQVEAFGAALRTSPGLRGILKQWGLEGLEAPQQIIGVVDKLRKQFAGQPNGYAAATRMAGLFGLDEAQFKLMWENLDRLRAAQTLEDQKLRDTGKTADQAAQDFLRYQRTLHEVTNTLDNFQTMMADRWTPAATNGLKIVENFVKAMMVLDKETKGTSTAIAGLVAALGSVWAARNILALFGIGSATTMTGVVTGLIGTLARRIPVLGSLLYPNTANAGEEPLYKLNPKTGKYEGTSELTRQRVMGGTGGGAPIGGGATAGTGGGGLSGADRDLLIRTVIGEAAREPDQGQEAVAHVVMNRLRSGRYGANMQQVLFAPRQFEPWNTRRAELMGISTESDAYKRAAARVDAVLAGALDPTKGATNFANVATVAARGNARGLSWIEEMRRNGTAMTIGNHTFGSPDSGPGRDLFRPNGDPGPAAAGSTTANINQKTDINVAAGPTAYDTARRVMDSQTDVNSDLLRNTVGAFR